MIDVLRSDDATWQERLLGISRPTVMVRLDDTTIGRVRDLAAKKLFFFPMIMSGCGLIDEPPSWTCFARFRTEEIAMKEEFGGAERDGSPKAIDRLTEVVPALLGLEERWTDAKRR